jgi:hypothetical protein
MTHDASHIYTYDAEGRILTVNGGSGNGGFRYLKAVVPKPPQQEVEAGQQNSGDLPPSEWSVDLVGGPHAMIDRHTPV